MKQQSRSLPWTLGIAAALSLWSGNALPAAAQAEPAAPAAEYHAVTLERDGQATAGALDQLVRSVRQEIRGGDGQIVVMIHGFDTDLKDGARDYGTVAQRLRKHAEAAGQRFAAVGLHWASDAGSQAQWMSRAVVHRVTSLLGMRKAVKNPYLEMRRRASRVGRTGARAVFFRLQDEFPGTPVHVFAHSLGSEVTVAALAPEGSVRKSEYAPVEQLGRELRLDLVTLAGADLDHDAFARNGAALDRANKWWITVPKQAHADAILELRRAAGQGDALGNRGLSLRPEDEARLHARNALVLDRGNVPTGHAFIAYYNETRIEALAQAMLGGMLPGTAVAQDTAGRAG